MKADMDKLRGKMAEMRMTQESLATRIGVDASTLNRKMKKDGLAFTVGQMHAIVSALALSQDEARQIFLSENSHLCDKSAKSKIFT